MNDPKTLTKISTVAKITLVVSGILFLLSLIPLSYSTGYSNGLAGTAGGNPTPSNSLAVLTDINTTLALLSGLGVSLAAIVGAITSIQKTRLEHATEQMIFKQKELEYKMQMREIDKLKLELKLEEQEKRKKKRAK